jgi:hypothetical protein
MSNPHQPGKLKDEGQGVVRDDRGEDQPADQERAQRDSALKKESGLKSQKEAAQSQVQSPGQPASGE